MSNPLIHPGKNREKSNAGIKTAEFIMRTVAMFATSGGTAVFAYSISKEYIPAAPVIIHLVSGVCAACIAAWLTDLMFGELLQRVTFDTLVRRHPNLVKQDTPKYFARLRNVELAGFAVLLVSLFIFDMYTTVIIKDPISNAATGKNLIDIDSLYITMNTAALQETDKIAADAKAKASEAKEAETRARNSNKALVKLASSGNGWASSEIEKAAKRASASSRKTAEKLEAQSIELFEKNKAFIAKRVEEAEQRNAAAMGQNTSMRSAIGGMYIAFTCIPKLLSILLRVLMVVTFLAYSKDFNPDINGDGFIDYRDVSEYYEKKKNPKMGFQ